MLPGGRDMDQIKVMLAPFMRVNFHFGALHFPATSLQGSLSSAVLFCLSGTGIKELVLFLCEFGAACFPPVSPARKRITEKSRYMYPNKSILLAFLGLTWHPSEVR